MNAQSDIQQGLISVIMPCFNAQAHLREAIDSVLAQSYPRTELIVVDDGSTDGSMGILRSYGERITVLSRQNQGPYFARNNGVRASHGAYLAFLDADDYWTQDCLEKLHAGLKTNARAALSYCGWQNVGLSEKRGEPFVPPNYELKNKPECFLRAASPWPIHAVLIRREFMEQIGCFNVYLPTCMDYDLWLRIAITNPVVLVPEVLAFYRHHQEGQITSKQWRQALNIWRVKKWFVEHYPEITSNLSAARLRQLIDGGLLQRGYDNYWRRDLISARRIFRKSLLLGAWRIKDLRYLLPALLPESPYIKLITIIDRR